MRKIVFTIMAVLSLLVVPATASALKFKSAPGTPLVAGTAQFDPPEVITSDFVPADLTSGFFNDDNYEDIAVVSDVSRLIYVYLGSADGSLAPSASNPIGSNSDIDGGRLAIHASDLDKDGDADLVTTSFDTPTLEVYLNRRIEGPTDHGSEGFGTVPDSVLDLGSLGNYLAGYTSTSFGDKDGDGDDDLAVGMTDNKYAYLKNVDGEFENPDGAVSIGGPSPTDNGSIYSTAIGDFNGDGQGDLVAVSEPYYDPENPGASRLLYAASNGDSTFADSVSIMDPVTEGSISNLKTVDLNGDQFDDLIFEFDGPDEFTGIAYGSASGPVVQDPADSTLDVAFHGGTSLGDYNGDGKVDVGMPMFNDLNFEIALGDGKGNLVADPSGPFALPKVGGLRFLPQRTATLDVNGDGQLDFAAVSGHSGDPDQGRGVAVMLGQALGARLSLRLKSAKKVKPGKKLLVTATIRNTGDFKSGAIAVRAAGPKRSVGKVKPIRIKVMPFGKSAVRKFRFPVKKNARGRFKVKVTVTASGKKLLQQSTPFLSVRGSTTKVG